MPTHDLPHAPLILADLGSPLAALGMIWGIVMMIAGIAVNILLAIAVLCAPPCRAALAPRPVWALATLFTGITAAGIFWVLHFGLPTRPAEQS